jgi:hypothetical protein
MAFVFGYSGALAERDSLIPSVDGDDLVQVGLQAGQ